MAINLKTLSIPRPSKIEIFGIQIYQLLEKDKPPVSGIMCSLLFPCVKLPIVVIIVIVIFLRFVNLQSYDSKNILRQKTWSFLLRM
jgi:hypothetical protein